MALLTEHVDQKNHQIHVDPCQLILFNVINEHFHSFCKFFTENPDMKFQWVSQRKRNYNSDFRAKTLIRIITSIHFLNPFLIISTNPFKTKHIISFEIPPTFRYALVIILPLLSETSRNTNFCPTNPLCSLALFPFFSFRNS